MLPLFHIIILSKTSDLLAMIDLVTQDFSVAPLKSGFKYNALNVFPDSSMFCIVKSEKFAIQIVMALSLDPER